MIKDRAEFDKKVISLMINFNFTPDGGENGLTMYMANLHTHLSETFGLTDQQFLRAIDSFIFNGIKYKKFPDASDFLNALGMSPRSMGIKAWVHTKKMIQSIGRYKSVRFGKERKHLALHETINQLGGWVDLCNNTYSEMEKLELRFIDTFIEIYANSRLKEDTYLIGQYDTTPVEISNNNSKAITYNPEERMSQIEKLKREQYVKNGWNPDEVGEE